MPFINKANISPGVFMVEIPAANLRVLCGCPPDCVKHLIQSGAIKTMEVNGLQYETGPNAILLSDYILQNESFANMAEFPVLQMLYRQGMLIPGHPNNTGIKPLLIGNHDQISAQLNYIYRGNYGLISPEEMRAAGAKTHEIDELMRIKLKFAFGRIADSQEFLDTVVVGEGPQELRSGVSIERTAPNLFEFQYQGESVQVDLNLKTGEKYLPPVALKQQAIELADFAIIQSGQGDGWDIERTAMSSILMYQGQIYLIDAGPSVMSVLRALGIGLNEIAGLFHTHSHDDHFAGLPDLIRSDRRLKYYATPLVRASVVKKLCALLSIDASELNHYLDFQDLPTNSWSDLAGLEVRPVISPHPVETTIFQFRVKNELGYKTYAHLADIASFEYIDEIIQGNSAPFKSPLCEVAKAAYLDRADVKKIDIGGGLIHGVAKDFIHDSSSKKILAHAASPLTQEEQSIGVNVPFGSVDVLIQASQDYEIGLAQHHLSQLYPTIDAKDMQALLSCPVVSMSPDENLLPIGLSQESIYLILRGYLELRDDQQGLRATFSAGTVAGELAALLNKPAFYNHIAASYGSALKIPAELYREIALKNNLYPERQLTEQKRLFLLACWLFEDGISYVTLNRLVNALQQIEFKKGEQFSLLSGSSIYLVKSGSVEVRRENHPIKTVSPYQFFGESAAFAGQPHHDMIEVLEDASCYRLDASILAKIPVCRWKLLQTMQRSISRSPV